MKLSLSSSYVERWGDDLSAACQYLEGPARKLERDISQWPVGIGQGGTAVN